MLPVLYFTQFWFKAGIKPFKKKRAFFYYEEFYIFQEYHEDRLFLATVSLKVEL